MTSKELAVFAYLPGEPKAVPAGLLTLEEEGAVPKGAGFVYGLRYLDRAYHRFWRCMQMKAPGNVQVINPLGCGHPGHA